MGFLNDPFKGGVLFNNLAKTVWSQKKKVHAQKDLNGFTQFFHKIIFKH